MDLKAEPLRLLYQDTSLVAVFKPEGLLVHRSGLAPDRSVVMTLLRDQLGQPVWPVHRLDRATEGLLLFALNPDEAARWGKQFQSHQVQKTYMAFVRGWCPEKGEIDYPLQARPERPAQGARTGFRRLATVTLPYAVGKYPEGRYSLVAVSPETGRFHQIRKHFHHVSHHLIGDTVYGDGRHNRLFRELGLPGLWLFAQALETRHPDTGALFRLGAAWPPRWLKLFEVCGLDVPELEWG